METSAKKGFSVVEVVIVVAVVALGGFLGYKFFGAMNKPAAPAPVASTTDATSNNAPIKSSKDLDAVNKQLDAVDVAGSFEQELNSASSF